MIAKRIALKTGATSSAVRLTNYITHTKNTISRVGDIIFTNVASDSNPYLAAQEIESVQKLNARSKADKTYHLLLSFRAGEEPTPETLRKIEKEISAALGYAEHQRIAVVHNDTDNLHMHIAINKVHPDKLTVHQPRRDFKILADTCAHLEKKYFLTVDNHERRDDIPLPAPDMEHLSGMESLESWMKRECLDNLKSAQNWQAFHTVLAEHGLTIQQRGNGFVFSTPDKITVKASSIDRSFSKSNLVKSFGEFEPPSGISNVTIKKRYSKSPLHTDSESKSLFSEFQESMTRREIKRNDALALLSEERGERSSALRAIYKTETELIRRSGWSATRKLRFEAAKLEHKQRMGELAQEMRERRKAVFAESGRLPWLDWLRKEAESGREDAIKALRARAYGLAKKFNAPGISGENKGNTATIDSSNTIDVVTKKGTVLYQVGKEIVRHDADGYTVSQESSSDTAIMALTMAKRRFGNTLTITGDAEFKEKMISAAVTSGMKVSFADERMESERKRRIEEQRAVQAIEKNQDRKGISR